MPRIVVPPGRPSSLRRLEDGPELAGPGSPRDGGAPWQAVFVDATGRRQRATQLVGWIVAAGCIGYLGAVGLSMTGTTVGPLTALPPANSKDVRFPREVFRAPGALEAGPLPPTPSPALAVADAAGPQAPEGELTPAPAVPSPSPGTHRLRGAQ